MVSVSKVSCLVAAAFAAVVSSVQADTIAEIAAGNPDFSTLVAALQEFAPELLDAASSEDAELTVFAPNNDAFGEFLASQDVELSELDPLLVKGILQAHVINKVVLATDLSDGDTVESIGGYPLNFDLSSSFIPNPFVCANAFACNYILDSDIIADNGVIHVIGDVIFADDIVPAEEAPAEEAPAEEAPAPGPAPAN